MKLICLNCNGIRSAFAKGLEKFLKKENADIICFQEIKADKNQVDLKLFETLGYHIYFNSAKKKGYSGTAVLTKIKPKNILVGMDHALFDDEGRNIILEFKNFALVNTYFPSGTSGEERQAIKMKFLDYFLELEKTWEKKYKKLVLCGDYNIAHNEIDIHDPKGNSKNSGFLPEERKWMTGYLDSGIVDTFRHLHPGKKDEYSWWTYRFNARSRNKGWRIDYFFVTKNLADQLISSKIDQSLVVSDHAPLILEIDL
ncbi:MAG: exodeoxyribonuclease III [Leptospira sp.]|nr:exodeoxyribonuclease III [Leptospira sp.]